MPRSLPRRVDLLERGAAARPVGRMSDEDLLAWVERVARERPSWLPPVFHPAWERYVIARGELIAAGTAPPPDYRPGLPADRRLQLWFGWDAPRIGRAVSDVLGAIDAASST